jgi:hypothetical protein
MKISQSATISLGMISVDNKYRLEDNYFINTFLERG